MKNELEQIFEFAAMAEGLKKILRFKDQYYWRDYPPVERPESVADHSWRLALLVMSFDGKVQKKFNLNKAIKLALLHDLPEVIAGDSHPMENGGKFEKSYLAKKDLNNSKFEKENTAAKEIFSKISNGGKLYKLWLEFELQKSLEAKIVKALDKIECIMQMYHFRGGHIFKGHLDFAKSYIFQYSKVDPIIHNFANLVFNKMKKDYKEFKK